MHCMTRISQQECRGILENGLADEFERITENGGPHITVNSNVTLCICNLVQE